MLEHLTLETFKEKIMNFETVNDSWNFQGELPAIIKFTAPWCSPCKTLTPILEEISKEYNDKLNIYEVDVDEEIELSSMFKIRSVPTMLFCAKNNEKQSVTGMMPKNNIVNIIEEKLL